VCAACPLPQVEDRRRLNGPGGAHGVLLFTQADTVAKGQLRRIDADSGCLS
jgi:hypothetical protein